MKTMMLAGLMALMVTALPADTNAPTPSGATAPADSPSAQALAKIKADLQSLNSADHADEASTKQALTSLYGETKDFPAKYPGDAQAPDVTLLSAQLGEVMLANHWDGAPTNAELTQSLDQLALNDKLPKPARAQARLMEIGSALQAVAPGTGGDAAFKALQDRIAQFEKEFGADYAIGQRGPVLLTVRGEELNVLASLPDHTQFDALVKQLSASSDPQMVQLAKDAAAKEQQAADLMSKPLDLKYTALDGTAVDLAGMRGKVVLVDFWATWCGPCVGEVPNVVAAYQKYHDQGFEIVGVSLDQDKDAVTKFTQQHGMVWPQYFDGQGWGNAISKRFGIDSIPAMWLVGKDGKLITTNAREDLAGQVEKALAVK